MSALKNETWCLKNPIEIIAEYIKVQVNNLTRYKLFQSIDEKNGCDLISSQPATLDPVIKAS